jgi:hypothetical protein
VKKLVYIEQALVIFGNEISVSTLTNAHGLNAVNMITVIAFCVVLHNYCVGFGGIILNYVNQLHNIKRKIVTLFTIS